MPRDRIHSPDFWTRQAVIQCAPMTRLLLLGMTNYADDFGVQPLRPYTIRLQVLPGDALDDDAVRVMIDELAARGLVRVYSVDGQEYVAIEDWEDFHRIGKRARRRWPTLSPAAPEVVAEPAAAVVQPVASDAAASSPPPPPPQSPPPIADSEIKRWHVAIGRRLRAVRRDRASIEAMAPAETAHFIGQWIAEGCDLERDVLAAVNATRRQPLIGLSDLAGAVAAHRGKRLAA